jgi:pimeloyl-ACP methyl ester carboxylesterase
LEDCADDVAALAEVLGITQLIPVGYSMGGPVATLVWRRHRKLVTGLVLCATAARFTGSRPADRIWVPSMLGLSIATKLTTQRVRERMMSRFVHNRYNDTHLSAWASGELARNDPVALLRAGAALGSFDGRGWLSTIDVPTAVVITETDRIVPTANQRWLADHIPEAESFSVDGDHTVCGTDAARFVPVLVRACQSVARRAAAAGHDPEPMPTP